MKRQAKSFWGFVVSSVLFLGLLVAILVLSGCAQITRLRVPMMAYYCPHTDYQEEAFNLLTHIVFAPVRDLNLDEEGNYIGNTNRWGTYYVSEDKSIVAIYLREELKDPINEEAYLLVRNDELCHVYEIIVLEVPREDTDVHKGWLNYFEHIELTTGKRPGIFPWS